MVNFLVLFDRCACCEAPEPTNTTNHMDNISNNDLLNRIEKKMDNEKPDNPDEYFEKMMAMHKSGKKDHTFNIKQLEKIYEFDSISVIEKYLIPALIDKIKPKIKQKATYTYDRNFNIIETSNNLLEIIGIPQGLFNSANMYKWMSNIHKDCFEKVMVRWILFKQKSMSGIKDIFIEKYRFVHGEEKNDGITRQQNIRYTFSICKPVISEMNFINNIKGELYEIDSDTWFNLDI